MELQPFKLERYFALYEFNVRYLLSASDCEALSMQDLLALSRPETRRLWDELSLAYTESQGHPLLRQEVAARFRTVKPDDVLIAVPEEAIFIAMNAILRPGDRAVCLFPAYQSLYEVAAGLGCEVARLPLTPGPVAWDLDLDLLERSIDGRTRLLVVNFPHNPTGFLPTRAQFDAIVALADRAGLYLFSDEMYRGLEYNAAAALPAACDVYERGISLSGLSKTFALPGLRTGWLATRDRDLLARCCLFKDYTTICGSAPAEILAIVALQAADALAARSLDIIRGNLREADAFFARHPALFSWRRPQAGSVALPRFDSSVPIAEFCQGLLREQSTMLVPGDIFEYGGNFFRLGLGRRSFSGALARLEAYLGTNALAGE
jgi:aspartate/methionine/tyrosine aminotransferase